MKQEVKEAIEYAIIAIKIRINQLPKKRPDRNQLWEKAWAHRHKVELERVLDMAKD